MKTFEEYVAERENTTNVMAARRSYNRSTGKFGPQMTKPVAILTAFRGGEELSVNRAANVQLMNDLKSLGLSFYPVRGAGQEQRRFLFILFRYVVPMIEEESFVVQPRAEMHEAEFESVIFDLLQKYGQFAAMMKLPSSPVAFLLYSDAEREYQASDVVPTTVKNRYYTRLYGGPRADDSMLRPWEIYGERNPAKRLINWWGGRSYLNDPASRAKIGRRFSIPEKQPGEA